MRPFHCQIIDAYTKAYWRFGERLSLLDQSGNGLTLTAYNGASISESGLVLDGTAAKYAVTAAAIALVGQTGITLEAWAQWTDAELQSDWASSAKYLVRWDTAAPVLQYITVLLNKRAFPATEPHLITQAYLGDPPSNLQHTHTLTADQWAAIRAGMCHIEAAVDIAAGRTYLFLNGAVLANVAKAHNAIASANGTFTVGYTAAGTTWRGPVDEMRLSTALRHTAAFVPRRFTDGARNVIRGPGEPYPILAGVGCSA